MHKQVVKNWMTTDPITITTKTTLPEAAQLMKENGIRRLPVVEDGRLVGIVTWGDIREASASDSTSLSKFELYYLLDKLTVGLIMTRSPITVRPLTPISGTAQLMLENKIGSLPVVDHDRLVGIITESDIFRMVVSGIAA
jgi:acetoin utilization protein AcuB